MDIRLPGMNGFEATQLIMAQHPMPIVVVSASVECAEELQIIHERAPGRRAERDGKAGRHQPSRLRRPRRTPLYATGDHEPGQSDPPADAAQARLAPSHAIPPAISSSARCAAAFRMLGIVASTGGPNALVELLGGLDRQFSVASGAGPAYRAPAFLEGFVSWLERSARLPVKIVKDGSIPCRRNGLRRRRRTVHLRGGGAARYA